MSKWSYSGLKQYENCARQYHEVKVLQRYPREDTTETLYGKDLHLAAELFIKEGKPLEQRFKFMQPTMDQLAGMPGRKFCELEMGVTNALEPCDFKDPNYWAHGIADLVIVNDENLSARVFDYKSGSDKYPDTDQLTLMSLMVMAHFPHVRSVTSGLLFVVKGTVVKHSVSIDQWGELWWNYRERVAKLDASLADGVWNPKQSGLCKRHCPCTDCEFNGRR